LIVVNCIILGRAEAFASKNGPIASIADGLGIGLGFTLSLGALGAVREIIGAGEIWGVPFLTNLGYEPFAFMVKPAGAFVTLGVMLALINLISVQLEARKRRS
jgi:electron transport complex protein RnfE